MATDKRGEESRREGEGERERESVCTTYWEDDIFTNSTLFWQSKAVVATQKYFSIGVGIMLPITLESLFSDIFATS